jgi:UDP-N-acetylmuramyl pentapeptide phosphotransferase/UDP-N-acetylglucosamine-1-phosphate transferase
LVFIIAGTFGLYFLLYGGSHFDPYAKLCFCLMGSVAGFLRYNMHKAIIFMGDTGSLVCGFLVAVMSVEFLDLAGQTIESTPSLAVATLIIPIFDTARVFSIRILNGRSPFSPDKNHIHHVLRRAGLSQLGVVFTLAAINLVFIFAAATLDSLGDTILIGAMGAIILVIGIALEVFLPYKQEETSEVIEDSLVSDALPKEPMASPI